MMILAAALVLTSGLLPARDEHCLGAYGAVAASLQVPTGSWYRDEIGPGGGLSLTLGHRVHRRLGIEGSYLVAIADTELYDVTAGFQLVTLNARIFAPPNSSTIEPFLDAGVSPTVRLGVGGVGNRGYAAHAGLGFQFGERAVRGALWTRWHFVRFTHGSADGISGSLGRQRHGDLFELALALTIAP